MLNSVRNGGLVFLIVLTSAVLGQDRDRSVARTASTAPKEEAQIRANVDAFVKAYNAGDAKAIANLFVPEAQIIDEDGKTTQGRDAIEKVFAAIFSDSPKGKTRVDVESIRFVGSALAIETGRAKTISSPGETPDETRYTAVHVKSPAGKWRMGFVRDTPNAELTNAELTNAELTNAELTNAELTNAELTNAELTNAELTNAELTNAERLKPLEWLIGDWVDESPESIVSTSCQWSDKKSFLLQDVHVHMRGREAMHLTQRIGWDPLTKQIKAWTFDSEGGYGESFWTRDGDRWLAKATAVHRNGTTASMTNIFTPVGKDAYRWRSTDRVVGGEVLPPLEVKVVRKAPDAALTK